MEHQERKDYELDKTESLFKKSLKTPQARIFKLGSHRPSVRRIQPSELAKMTLCYNSEELVTMSLEWKYCWGTEAHYL